MKRRRHRKAVPGDVHAAEKVWQLLDGSWKAPCSCGWAWSAETKVGANRRRNKHIHKVAVERRFAAVRARKGVLL